MRKSGSVYPRTVSIPASRLLSWAAHGLSASLGAATRWDLASFAQFNAATAPVAVMSALGCFLHSRFSRFVKWRFTRRSRVKTAQCVRQTSMRRRPVPPLLTPFVLTAKRVLPANTFSLPVPRQVTPSVLPAPRVQRGKPLRLPAQRPATPAVGCATPTPSSCQVAQSLECLVATPVVLVWSCKTRAQPPATGPAPHVTQAPSKTQATIMAADHA
jgi:hypothetical protein